MIKEGSLLRITDNSGAKTARCIKILGGYKKKTAKEGDMIVVTVQNVRDRISFKKASKVKKKDIFKAMIVRTKFITEKKSRIKFKFKDNSAILLDKQNNPIGTRLIGFVSKKLHHKFPKLVALSLKKF
jgi:large subunit ribosomal protein L14